MSLIKAKKTKDKEEDLKDLENTSEEVEEIQKEKIDIKNEEETKEEPQKEEKEEKDASEEEEQPKAEKKTQKRNTKKEKRAYRIIIATPTYFVINKDGTNTVVHKKNSYRRGDEVEL